MKKIVLILAGALCLRTAAFAQDPTPQPPKDSTSIQPTQPTQPTEQPAPDASTPAYRKDMTQVQPSDVPTGLRSTLDRPQFKGWETGAVYSNVDKSVFIVEIKDETEGRTKAYRFDANGKPISNE
jgi:hypothetical protein